MKNYGIPIIGTMDDLNNIKVSDLKKWYSNYYVPNNATLILAGNFESNNAKFLIKKYYGNYSKQKVINYSKVNKHEISFDEIIQSLQLVFQLIDKNQDGNISQEEIVELKNIIESLS